MARTGCSEEVIAAGILHDTVEDTPVTLEQIKEEFGDYVMELVQGASEPDKSLSWEDRKKHTLEYLRTAPLDIKCMGCADKLHNAWSIIQDLQEHGESVWERFNRGKEQQLWYYKGVYESLIHGVGAKDRPQIFEDYRKAIEQLEAL